MFYAEKIDDVDAGESRIDQRGIFISLDEFVPYRLKGWSGAAEINAAADAIIEAQDAEDA